MIFILHRLLIDVLPVEEYRLLIMSDHSAALLDKEEKYMQPLKKKDLIRMVSASLKIDVESDNIDPERKAYFKSLRKYFPKVKS